MNQPSTKKACLLIVVSAAMISAAPTSSPDELIRAGNRAVEQGDFSGAVLLYQQAEERGSDPGLIAFNKATAYYHLQDFRQAENHYRMALDDGAIPAERRARVLYNIGDSLVKQAGDSDLRRLRDAIRFFDLCLEAAPEEGLRQDAAHNLELAKLLWNKARARTSNPPAPNSDEPPDEEKAPDSKKKQEEKRDVPEEGPDSGKNKEGKNPAKIDPNTKLDKEGKTDAGSEPKKMDAPAPPDAGPPVLPDTDQLQPQSAEDTLKALKAIEARLHQERRWLRIDAAIPEKPSGKDW